MIRILSIILMFTGLAAAILYITDFQNSFFLAMLFPVGSTLLAFSEWNSTSVLQKAAAVSALIAIIAACYASVRGSDVWPFSLVAFALAAFILGEHYLQVRRKQKLS